MEWIKEGEVVARELYDRVEDPQELNNLVEGDERSEVAETLSRKLDRGKGWRGARPR